MVVAVFGGFGHVGSWVVHDLVERGDDVVVFDAGPSRPGDPGLEHLARFVDRIVVERVDVLDTHTLFERMLAYDGRIEAVIFGVAVIAGPDFAKRPFRNVQTNTMGMMNVVEACRVLGVPRFVNMSSGAVYGDQPGGQTEETPYKATDLYCATKIANEVFALQYGQEFGIDVRNARLYFVYGPGRMPSRMNVLYRALFGPLEGLGDIECASGIDQVMDWTHVRDTARGVVAVLDAEGKAGRSFNVSSGVAVAHRTIVDEVSRIVGGTRNVSIGSGDFYRRGAPLDITKTVDELGFRPEFVDIRSGLEDYRRWIVSS